MSQPRDRAAVVGRLRILFARGTFAHRHNQLYYEKVEERCFEYWFEEDRDIKHQIALSIYEYITVDLNGDFWTRVGKKKVWTIVPQAKALPKIKQALREKALKLDRARQAAENMASPQAAGDMGNAADRNAVNFDRDEALPPAGENRRQETARPALGAPRPGVDDAQASAGDNRRNPMLDAFELPAQDLWNAPQPKAAIFGSDCVPHSTWDSRGQPAMVSCERLVFEDFWNTPQAEAASLSVDDTVPAAGENCEQPASENMDLLLPAPSIWNFPRAKLDSVAADDTVQWAVENRGQPAPDHVELPAQDSENVLGLEPANFGLDDGAENFSRPVYGGWNFFASTTPVVGNVPALGLSSIGLGEAPRSAGENRVQCAVLVANEDIFAPVPVSHAGAVAQPEAVNIGLVDAVPAVNGIHQRHGTENMGYFDRDHNFVEFMEYYFPSSDSDTSFAANA